MQSHVSLLAQFLSKTAAAAAIRRCTLMANAFVDHDVDDGTHTNTHTRAKHCINTSLKSCQQRARVIVDLYTNITSSHMSRPIQCNATAPVLPFL